MKVFGDILTALTRHRVSANVLMLVLLLSGAWAMTRLTIRFFPPFETNTIFVSVTLAGASSSDIEESVVIPMENSLRNVPDFDRIFSYSRENNGLILLEFPDNVDLNEALENVKAEAATVNLPDEADEPRVSTAEFDIHLAKITVVGTHIGELRNLVRNLENDLSSQDIGKVSVTGIPGEEIVVLVDQEKLIELGLSLSQIGRAVAAQNSDASIGSLTSLGNERQVRTDSKTSELSELYNIPITTNNGDIVYLRDIALIERRTASDQVTVRYNGRPAATMKIESSKEGNIINDAEKLYTWLDKKRENLPVNVQLVAHDEEWRYVQSRLSLLVNNGATGMVLVIAILYLFLSRQVALWVAAGIPAAMFGTLFIFYLTGGTINMLSMFALIMAVGIIVDDAIVVGENAQYRLSRGDPPMRAVISAAKNMFTPVFASSFTTIAAFLPLFLVSGPIGSIIFDIPLIIVCILLVALVECFLILPGHLYYSFSKRAASGPGVIRRRLDAGFETFRESFFRPIATFAVRHALATVVTCFMIMYLSISLLLNGFVGYRFFPGVEGNKAFATVAFSSGTPRVVVDSYVKDMIIALEESAQELAPDQKLVEHVSVYNGQGGQFTLASDNQARILVELVDADTRNVTVSQFTTAWRSKLDKVPGITELDVTGEQSGPPGHDIEVQLTAPNVSQIKQSAQRVKEALATIPGVTSIKDDTPYGKEEVILELTPVGRSLNVDTKDISDQLHDALDGFKVQTFTEGVDDVELKVKLANVDFANIFNTMYLRLPSGEYAPLRDIVTWRTTQGFDVILHQYGKPSIIVFGDLDPEVPTTVGAVLNELRVKVLDDMQKNENITYSFEGKTADEQQTAKEMMTGLVLALILIYIILTWVFNSWSLPVVIMLTMPFGVIGTILGHWIMGLSMSILSFFGMFTLMGIIVNNSIVLVGCFKDIGVVNKVAAEYNAAIVEASCLRLRAVTLTSLTTICGLLPLMFETSLQAQFLIPMATSIVFGLAFATVLILLFMPACMSIHGAIGRSYHTLAAKVERHTFQRPFPRT